MKKLIALMLLTAFLTVIAFLGLVSAKQETCPNDAPWIKVDSDDLSQLPDDYVEACFKFGSANSEGCQGGISNVWPPDLTVKHCGLSHYSYIPVMASPTPTTVDASGTPTPTTEVRLTPTETPSPTATPSATPSPTNTPEDTRFEEVRRIEGETFGPQK